jgi:tryptophan halogenase
MSLPDSLQAKLDLWMAKGRVFRDELELFATPNWVAVCLGQGLVPAEYEPVVDALDEDKVAAALEDMRIANLQLAERLPTHGEFISQILGQRPTQPEVQEFVL